MNLLDTILGEITGVINKVDRKELEDFVGCFSKDKRVFVDGEGRSGLQAKGFAMRLMHIGYTVYVVGETITPAVEKEDLFIAVSGSGTSSNVVSDTKKALLKGAEVLSVTSKRESALAKLAGKVLVIPGTVKSEQGENRGSIQLLSSLFDQSLHITLDCVCLMISSRDNTSNETATNAHW